MWNTGTDEWYIFDVVVILDVVSHYRDESELDATIFNGDEERNNLTLFELIAF
jgi:hypothetical protein